MDQQTITMKCLRCGKPHRVLEMVMDASGKGMACRACAGLAPKGAKSSPLLSPTGPRVTPVSTRMADGARRRYTCTDCRYKFSSSKPVAGMSCPYCGGSRIATEKESSADALLKGSLERRYE